LRAEYFIVHTFVETKVGSNHSNSLVRAAEQPAWQQVQRTCHRHRAAAHHVLKKMFQGQAVSLKNWINFQDSFIEKMATFQDMSE
jgi:hypothetical protein